MNKQIIYSVLSSKKTKWLLSASAVSFSIVVLIGLVFREFDNLKNFNWQLNWCLLLPVFLLYIINQILVSYVWMSIIRTLGYSGNFLLHLQNYSISNLMKRIPGTVWYVAWRTQAYNTEIGLSPRITTLASGIELSVYGISTVVTSLIFSLNILANDSLQFIGLIGMLCFFMFILLPPIRNRFLIWAGNNVAGVASKKIFYWICIYFITRLIGGSMFFLVINVFVNLPLHFIGPVIGIHSLVASIVLLVFFLPTNFGLTEVGLSLFLSSFIPSSVSVMVAVVNRLLSLVFDLIWGGIVYLIWRILHK